MNIVNLSTVELIKNNFKNKLSSSLKEQNYSKKELASIVKVSTNTIRNILKGENFKFDIAIKIDLALNLNLFTNNISLENSKEINNPTLADIVK